MMAIEIKRKAPNAHTVCEIVKARSASLHVLNRLLQLTDICSASSKQKSNFFVLCCVVC